MVKVERAKNHLNKYRLHKDFINNGFVDKTKYSGWYVTVMYYAICHLTCYYYVNNNIETLPMKDVDKGYDSDKPLSPLHGKFKIFESSRNRMLYTCLCVTPEEMAQAEQLFPEFEEKLLA